MISFTITLTRKSSYEVIRMRELREKEGRIPARRVEVRENIS